MKIAVIGCGAMGMLFGGYLSRGNDVTLIGRDFERMKQIEENGLVIEETNGIRNVYHPHAAVASDTMEPVDLVMLFVKAGDSQTALEANRTLIGKDTLLLTLQNGMGHEKVLRKFVAQENLLIGTTQQGSYRLPDGSVCHSGLGATSFGAVTGKSARFDFVAHAFTECGFPCETTDGVRGMVWNKLMINASSSVLSGVLQTAQGYVAENEDAWNIAQKLIRELCGVATADGWPFYADEQIERIRKHLNAAPGGYTSVYADLKAGRKTEVDVITGAVVDAAHSYGVCAPTHEMMLSLIHAMEQRS